MSHTPGPWTVAELREDGAIIRTGGRYEIRTPAWDVATYIPQSGPIRKLGDAHLIAAAPDLLAACKALISSLVEGWPPPDWDDNHLLMIQATAGDIREARAAIAEAKGG